MIIIIIIIIIISFFVVDVVALLLMMTTTTTQSLYFLTIDRGDDDRDDDGADRAQNARLERKVTASVLRLNFSAEWNKCPQGVAFAEIRHPDWVDSMNTSPLFYLSTDG